MPDGDDLMTRTLETRIARLEATCAATDNDFLVVHISNFFGNALPNARIGGNSGTVLKQAPDELFETFEARAIAAAKAAGDRFVAITVPGSTRLTTLSV
jgi:hypothetical protein